MSRKGGYSGREHADILQIPDVLSRFLFPSYLGYFVLERRWHPGSPQVRWFLDVRIRIDDLDCSQDRSHLFPSTTSRFQLAIAE